MAPIRIGFIGLSTGWWGPAAHLPYLQQTDKYTIAGLLNSSIASAEAAKSKHDLPSSTKCYASPSELANDPDIDLVVCSVRVDKHYETIKPSLEAGKCVYCEWPLGKNLAEAEELASLAAAENVKTMVGLQARVSPFILKIKDLVGSGRIGRVLSSTAVSAAFNHGASDPDGLQYLSQVEYGGNMKTIHFAHMIDYICFVLGELSSFNALESIQRSQVIITKDGKEFDTITRTAPDQILLHGRLNSGGVLSVHQRGGAPFKGEPGFRWTIYGEHGEIEVTAPSMFLNIGLADVQTLKLHDATSDTVEDIDWKSGAFESLPEPARNVARLYESWADGRTETYLNMQQCVVRHKMLDQLTKSSNSGAWVEYTPPALSK